MTRLSTPYEDIRKGAWTAEEDEKLRKYVETYGTGHWRSVGKQAGLQRCGKSCRLRWTNYLRPDIRHGSFSSEEENLIIKLHAAHGSRWSLIAAQMPGRTDNDIKNHWNTRLKKKLCDMGIDPVTHKRIADVLKELAGTMAHPTGQGNQVEEEARRRCRRESGSIHHSLAFQFMPHQSLNDLRCHNLHDTAALPRPELPSGDESQKSSINSGSYNMDESSSSTEEAPSRSPTSPLSSIDMEQSNQNRYYGADAKHYQSNIQQSLTGTVVEESADPTLYLSLPRINETIAAHFTETSASVPSSFQLPTLSLQSTSSEQFVFTTTRYASNGFHPSAPIYDTSESAEEQQSADYTRWLASTSALPQDADILNSRVSTAVQLPLIHFNSELHNYLGEDHATISYLHGSDMSKQRRNATASELDVRINLGFNQQRSMKENVGYSSSLRESLSTSPNGITGSIADITTQHTFSGCTGHNANSVSPNLNFTGVHSPIASTPAAMRLYEYPVPTSRMVLWDMQE